MKQWVYIVFSENRWGMQVQRLVFIPERIRIVGTGKWQRVFRQVYWLADGKRDDRRIALLLHHDASVIRQVLTALVGSGYIKIRNERKVLKMQVGLLRESYAMVAQFGDTFARWFYVHLFQDYPDAKVFFKNTNMRRQESSLMATLAAVIAGVERGENLVPVLQALGKKHAGYGVQQDHYPFVGATLIKTFHHMLGPRFTLDMEEAWSEAFDIISATMIAGVENK